jgi:hypothetical protein
VEDLSFILFKDDINFEIWWLVYAETELLIFCIRLDLSLTNSSKTFSN